MPTATACPTVGTTPAMPIDGRRGRTSALISSGSSARSLAGRRGSAAPSGSMARKPGRSNLGSGFVWSKSSRASEKGQSPALIIDFMGADAPPALARLDRARGPIPCGTAGRGSSSGSAVPPGTRDAIMSVGLMGATGTLDIDGLTVELIAVEAEPARTSWSTATSSWAIRLLMAGPPRRMRSGFSRGSIPRRRSS